MKYSALTAFLVSFLIQTSAAAACASGARCLVAPKSTEPQYSPGDILEPGSFNVVLNTQYHGLPKVTDGSWYVTVGRYVLRIEPDSYEVIEDVTSKARRAF